MIKWKNINWLLVASSFTAAYLIFIVVWIGPHKIIAFSETDQLNAIGDFLAGVFSPLAFIWLVAAVLTQRQELTDTRAQFAENQKVVDAQLRTINEQSRLLQQQHILAEDTAKKTYRLNLFEQRYKIYNELVAVHVNLQKFGITSENYSAIKAIRTKASFVFGDHVEKYFEYIDQAISEYFIAKADYNSALEAGRYKIERKRSEEQVAADDAELNMRQSIVSLLEPDALREVMWVDMQVSDS